MRNLTDHLQDSTMTRPRYTLTKEERLYRKSDIQRLLAKGRFGDEQIIRYRYLHNTDSGKNRIMISVSKRFFKRAVKRNLLKRRIRESYRMLKHTLPEEGGTDILFIYSTKEILSMAQISEAVGRILEKISRHGQK